jgi:hypothetical protein
MKAALFALALGASASVTWTIDVNIAKPVMAEPDGGTQTIQTEVGEVKTADEA